MKILLTGFEPFGDHCVNPSWEVAQRVGGRSHEEVEIVPLCLPVSFHRVGQILQDALAQYQPDAVLMMGVAPTRKGITVERIAVNVDDARGVDNDGVSPSDLPIIEDGPAAYFCTLPIKKMVESLVTSGFPATISNSAGTYVCNHALYEALHLTRNNFTQVGFIHLPVVSADESGLTLQSMCDAVEKVILNLKSKKTK